ncbi:MAG: efflux RND transporter periplasmic adaptor subunit [Gammaproteobacteria bacterium]|nr:efflux RND transporter periplasmic adaptor subunit [Gammaproteobacteria bacterium]
MTLVAAGLGAALLLGGCAVDGDATTPIAEPADAAAAPGPSGRTPLPPVVRRNLGITFASAVYRPVAASIVIPGHFEALPSAQHHYPLPVAGRVELHVAPLDAIERGQLLLELDAPAWRELQTELVELETTRRQAEAELARARAARLAAGDLAGAAPAGAFDVLGAEVRAARAAVNAAAQRLEQLIARAATLTGVGRQALRATTDGEPNWRRLDGIPIRAVADGVVREVDAASGTWVAEGTEVVHVVHLAALRFRGKALQADLVDHLRDGQRARILPPEGRGAARRGAAIDGRIRLGVTGDPSTRTVDVFVDLHDVPRRPWIRPQVTALAEIIVAGDPDDEELAIPLRAVIEDGLERVFFRRDPNDPDAVIRTVADLGPSDGRWVTVYSGVGENDEVVVDGVYQLKLATTGQQVEAGHFHADGTFHEGEH